MKPIGSLKTQDTIQKTKDGSATVNLTGSQGTSGCYWSKPIPKQALKIVLFRLGVKVSSRKNEPEV